MSDFDYGREKGLWGNDGYPYFLKYERDSSSNRTYKHFQSDSSEKKFNRSELLALKCGFKTVEDENAYNGRYFIKDGLKWIHNLKALKYTLGVSSEYELKQQGYDVDAYNRYNA